MKIVKKAGEPAAAKRPHTMHGTSAEWKLMSGTGALNKWSAEKVPLSGDKPAKKNRRPR